MISEEELLNLLSASTGLSASEILNEYEKAELKDAKRHGFNFKYMIYGTDVYSDIRLNIEDETLNNNIFKLKREIEHKILIDKIYIKNNKITAVPNWIDWVKLFGTVPRCYQIDFDADVKTKPIEISIVDSL